MFGYRMTKTDRVLLPVVAGCLSVLIYVAFRYLGFFGIGLFGVVVGLVAVTVDLERGWPQTNLWSSAVTQAREQMSREEKAYWRGEITRHQLPIFIGKVVSAGLIILGFGLFFIYQL